MRDNDKRWPEVIEFLDRNPGVFTYKQVAAGIVSMPRAVGQMMDAIHSRDHHQYCPRVVDKRTGEPGFKCDGLG